MSNISTTVICDLCKKEFPLTRNSLLEETLSLEKDNMEPHEVRLTSVVCPCCGKSYPVVMDDETTFELLERLNKVTMKRVKQTKAGFQVNPQLENRRKELERKLNFKRQKLAEKYNGSFYQLEDGTRMQLDYRYHVR